MPKRKSLVHNHFVIIPAAVSGKTNSVVECKYCSQKETENATRMEVHLAFKCKNVGRDIRDIFLSKRRRSHDQIPLQRVQSRDNSSNIQNSSSPCISNTWLSHLGKTEHDEITDAAAMMVYGKGMSMLLLPRQTTTIIVFNAFFRARFEFL